MPVEPKNTQLTVTIINGETIIHIPKNIVEQFKPLANGEPITAMVKDGQLILKSQ